MHRVTATMAVVLGCLRSSINGSQSAADARVLALSGRGSQAARAARLAAMSAELLGAPHGLQIARCGTTWCSCSRAARLQAPATCRPASPAGTLDTQFLSPRTRKTKALQALKVLSPHSHADLPPVSVVSHHNAIGWRSKPHSWLQLQCRGVHYEYLNRSVMAMTRLCND